ncbi:Undecaprenyl diphosphate synthase [Candidatus Syntrophocurvum alkaliphilum]|uniref:Isoprenyl transferase n=1 Tax=Candidatus Syntrophocurvum alkaliphilum TaxID=2293317 RepID=A0A6I6DDS1_9FIRM|nr:isoprenyl transferase [Candidatus Syntrophocurvum alkaliphilum]QGT99200.1 Undecaprenyl diphosphate synthase [Candidatus Syntrophocurvum alkaliphilum]
MSKNINYRTKLNSETLPKHIAIIMDGNGRWAKKRLLPRTAGHRAGMKSLRKVVETCTELKIQVLTVYAFSTENWKRPEGEVSYLMELLVEYLNKEIKELHDNNVKIQIIGDIQVLNNSCKQEINRAILMTENNTGLIFNIALNYGSRTEIIYAIKQVAEQIQANLITIDDINEQMLSNTLYTSNIPDPDLLIRTAGEMRLSNFLLWQIAYSELWITEKLWPDFGEKDLIKAIVDYQKRDRRFGGIK